VVAEDSYTASDESLIVPPVEDAALPALPSPVYVRRHDVGMANDYDRVAMKFVHNQLP
jgi:hypothetical protein